MAVDMNAEITTTTTARPEYTVRAVAERIGVPVPTLRSWTRRYGIGPGEHRPGTHRTYTEADIAVLERMVSQIAAGASPSSAAAAARRGSFAPTRPLDVGPILVAAHRLDAAELLAMFSEHFTTHGVVTTWESLCRPAFAEVVREQTTTGGCVDVEHVLSWAVITSLHRVAAVPTPGRVLLTCTEHELHTLPLEVLRAALAERGIEAIVLGSVPPSALADALHRTATPALVLLWANSPDTVDHNALRVAEAAHSHIYVGGPGWDDTPPSASVLRTLTEAVEHISRDVLQLNGS